MRKAVEGLLAVGGGGEGELSLEQLAVREAFQTATRALAEFRNMHLQMVTRYIIIPSRQPNGREGVNLATASSRMEASSAGKQRETMPGAGELTGTGGTALLPFLKQSRDETFQAGRLQVR
jgi:indoleamine 2,3-dioxygenase